MKFFDKSFQVSDFEITVREIIASISIVAVMILFGILISSKIEEYQMDKNEEYNKALKIESTDLFKHGISTNAGNAFVYGNLKAVDTVTYPDLEDKYMYVKKEEQHYNVHTQTYTTTDSKGRTHVRTRTYWSWDYAGSESKMCKEISFCGVIFPSNKIHLPDEEYISTVNKSSFVRYVYYGVRTKCAGTIYTKLADNTISDNSCFYNNSSIDAAVDKLESNHFVVVFWIAWIVVIAGVVFGFYYLDNEWLK